METNLKNIAAYFEGQLSDSERKAFESDLKTNTALAKEVAFYVQAKQAAKQLAIQERKAEFEDLRTQYKNTRTVALWPWTGALAAACVVLVGSWLFFNQPNTSELANNYIKNDIAQISLTMGADVDSIQTGIELYNDKKYTEALSIFMALNPKTNDEAVFKLEYTGLSQLQLGQYEKAISSFQTLAQKQNVVNNKGKFYEALTLMKRGITTDKNKSIQLLEVVVKEKLGNKKQAAEWLEKIK